MKIAMLRLGIDTGSGGILGPLFQDGTFEYVPIPDGFGLDSRTYSNVMGCHGRPLIDYFPASRQAAMQHQAMHVDPEFISFTYGDPGRNKSGLRHLNAGDMLIFYCGLTGWDCSEKSRLYLIGYFEVTAAGRTDDFSSHQLQRLFGKNFHVRHQQVLKAQHDDLVLVKGGPKSRLLHRALPMSSIGKDRAGRPLHVLSNEMQQIFGDFGGKISFQRSPTRWVMPALAAQSADFMRSLE